MSQRTIAYIRVSTEKQLDGSGPDQQRHAISAWALTRSIMIDEFAVDSETGDVEDRFEIVRLKDMAAAGELGMVIVDRLDRFARSLLVHETLYKFFRENGVKVVCVTQDFDDSPMGIAMRQMMAVFAQLDKAQRLSHLRQCRRTTTATKGTFAGGGAPYGYAATRDGKLELVPGETKLVVRAFELRGENLNFSAIARALNAEGFRTRKGSTFLPTQVQRIISHEAVYRGLEPVHHVELEAGVQPQQPVVLK